MNHLLALLLFLLLSPAAHAFPTYASGDGFRGAELMTVAERQAHVGRLQSMQTLAECEAYMNAHEQDLQSRARARNLTLPPRRGDPCAVMRSFGRIR